MPDSLDPELLQALADAFAPGARVVSARAFGEDEAGGGGGSTAKALGYGQPIRVELAQGDARRQVVVHTIRADSFGHDRRADRVSDVVLAFDEFSAVPGHVRALDAGLFGPGGVLSLATGGEPYLITEYVPGRPYAQDLRRIAADAAATGDDRARCETLARYLARLHDEPPGGGDYRRALRDTLGHGEGIFGLIDAFPGDAPAAPPERLRALEHRCLDQRWRLRDRGERLRRTHGDFHPFNLLFDGGELHVLDASRGCRGDPADDVTCMAINYAFFALGREGAWEGAFRDLWRRFWGTYFDQRADPGLLDAAPLYWTWRTLVVAHPRWYPEVTGAQRDLLLIAAERALDAGRFEPDAIEELFA